MIPKGPAEVNKFDLKVLVLFDTQRPSPYKETVSETLARSPAFDPVASIVRRGAGAPSLSRHALMF